jgi:primosomal protein N' (replication factor Y) (superfamily II helicase)
VTVSEDQLSLVPGKKKRVKAEVPIAKVDPVAQISIDSPLPHLDRLFDYAVPQKLDAQAVPGVRVRVRFAGKLTDGWLISRSEQSDHPGTLAAITNVISPEVVLLPQILELSQGVADRQAGTLSDVLRNAIPNRHAGAEATVFPDAPVIGEATTGAWQDYVGGSALIKRTIAGEQPRAIVTTGTDDPAELIAQYAMAVAHREKGIVVVVPDRSAIDRVIACLTALGCPSASMATLAADDGPTIRYRNWLSVLRGASRIVIGTRSAVFAPVTNLATICVWDDWNDTLADPQSPYWHARDVAVLRSSQQNTALVLIGATMSVEACALMPWVAHVAKSREQLRSESPKVRSALDEIGERTNPAASGSRIPSIVLQTMKSALLSGPVLVLVSRVGYTPRIICDTCRTSPSCSVCSGPLMQTARSSAPACNLCGHLESIWHCKKCKGTKVRAAAVGSERTAEELGRAFPGVPVRSSTSDHILRTVDSRPAIVVATAGAAPIATGGYAAAILLDGTAMLSRPDLSATQETFAKWSECVSLVRATGDVVVVADSEHPSVQALIRHDPAGFAQRELAERTQVSLPPAVRLAALTGEPADVEEAIAILALAPEIMQRGPVPGKDTQVRMLLSCDRRLGLQLSAQLKAMTAARSAKHKGGSVNVRIDPQNL